MKTKKIDKRVFYSPNITKDDEKCFGSKGTIEITIHIFIEWLGIKKKLHNNFYGNTVELFKTYKNRQQLSFNDVHVSTEYDISGYGKVPATSVICKKNDEDFGDVIIFTGIGENDLNDQQLEKWNLSLVNNRKQRVIFQVDQI